MTRAYGLTKKVLTLNVKGVWPDPGTHLNGAAGLSSEIQENFQKVGAHV